MTPGERSPRSAGFARTAWRTLRADRAALAGAAVLALIVLACFPGAPLAAKLVGHSADQYFMYATH